MVVVDATVGSAELKVNEVSVLTFSGNTKGTATAGVQAVSFFGNTGNNFAYDDIMIWNSQGLAPTDFVGDFRIDAYTPTANGSTVNATFVGAGVTVAYQAVDDPALQQCRHRLHSRRRHQRHQPVCHGGPRHHADQRDRRRHRGGGAGRQCRHPQDPVGQQIGSRDRDGPAPTSRSRRRRRTWSGASFSRSIWPRVRPGPARASTPSRSGLK
jgi:hypothetical protein